MGAENQAAAEEHAVGEEEGGGFPQVGIVVVGIADAEETATQNQCGGNQEQGKQHLMSKTLEPQESWGREGDKEIDDVFGPGKTASE